MQMRWFSAGRLGSGHAALGNAGVEELGVVPGYVVCSGPHSLLLVRGQALLQGAVIAVVAVGVEECSCSIGSCQETEIALNLGAARCCLAPFHYLALGLMPLIIIIASRCALGGCLFTIHGTPPPWSLCL